MIVPFWVWRLQVSIDAMNEEFSIGSQKLGVLVDPSVNSNTLNWIRSLSNEAIIRDASVGIPANDADFKNLSNHLLTGGIDAVVFFTAAGLEQFFKRAIKTNDQARLVDSLTDIQSIAVGGLVSEKMVELGVQPSMQVADGLDWRDLLVVMDKEFPVTNLTVAVEMTSDIHGLAAGLEARGASVVRVEAISFTQPDPSSPEQDILDAIEDGDLGTMLFPNPVCAARFAALIDGRERPILKRNSAQLIVLAIGDETQQLLLDRGIQCDVVLKDQHIRSEIENSSAFIRESVQRSRQNLSGPGSSSQDPNSPWYNSRFMKALRREPVDVTPVWMMRQAGRYMQEYRDVRSKVDFLELCKDSQLCSEVMCTAVAKLGVDAAIIFSDLLPILEPMGCDLEFVKGDGPVIHNPIRTNEDIDRVIPLQSNDELQFVMDTVKQTRMDLPADIPLIGFAGAPFSLASYMIEGSGTKHYAYTKKLMYGDTPAWNVLMSKLVQSVKIYLKGQVEAGAQCIQLFDSWAGCLGVEEYRRFVLPHVSEIIDEISPLVPVINFATGNPMLLPELASTSAQVIGVDWRIPIDTAWQNIGYHKAVQGNLDPAVLLSDTATIRKQAAKVLELTQQRNGHIFNLGHGILPQTPVENAIALVDIVHELSQR